MTEIIIAIIFQLVTLTGGQTPDAKPEKEKQENKSEKPITAKGGSSAYDDAPDK